MTEENKCLFCNISCGNDHCAYKSKTLKLQKGRKYTAANSDLIVVVFAVYYESDKYYKAKIGLLDKKGVMMQEAKTYKLYKKLIQHWKLV